MRKKLIALTAALALLTAMLLSGCIRPATASISGGDAVSPTQMQTSSAGAGCGGSGGGFSLTDEIPAEEDEEHSGSIDRLTVEVQTAEWEQQPDEASYMAMMKEKTQLYYDYMAQMAELQPTLSKYKNAKNVRANENYAALEAAMLQWANAALDYPEDGLTSPEASSVRTLSCMLADSTVKWLEVYPAAVCGESDGAKADALLDELMDSAVQLGAHF